MIRRGARVGAVSSAAPVYTMTPERMTGSTAVLLALIGAIIGGLALVRSARRIGNRGRRGAIVAIVLRPIGLIIVHWWWLLPTVVLAPATG
jgi:hypothetical protein